MEEISIISNTTSANPTFGLFSYSKFSGSKETFCFIIWKWLIDTDRTLNTKYYLPTVEIKDYNVMIDGKNFFNQRVKMNFWTYDVFGKLWPVREITVY